MFLLFNKVYAKYDFDLDNNVDNLIITDRLSAVFLEEIDTVWGDRPPQMHNVDTLEELWSDSDAPYDNDRDFFTALKNKEKVIIRMNRENYDKLFIKFIKLIYENLPQDVAWKVYNTFAQNSLQVGSNVHAWHDQAAQGLNAVVGKITKSDFITKWGNVTLDLPWADYATLRSQIRNQLPIEFLIANRLAGGPDADPAIGPKMYSLVADKVSEEANFLKGHLFNNIYKGWAQTVLDLDSDVNAEDDIFALKDTNDKTRWLLSDSDRMQRIDHTGHNISWSGLRKSVMDAVTLDSANNPNNFFEENLTDSAMDIIHANRSTKTMDSAQVNSIINNELRDKAPSVFEAEDRTKVNVLFLNYLYKLKNTSNAELNNFRL